MYRNVSFSTQEGEQSRKLKNQIETNEEIPPAEDSILQNLRTYLPVVEQSIFILLYANPKNICYPKGTYSSPLSLREPCPNAFITM